MNKPVLLIVGLGNPGREYERTRHNAGADFVAQVANTYRAQWSEEKKFSGLLALATIDHQPVRLLLPTTYMNRSGHAVGAVAHFYKIPLENILVAHDEIDLPPGSARLKAGGGHGGHNGLRDIINTFGNQNQFMRLRLGVGHPGDAKRVADYVLKKAGAADTAHIANGIQHSLQALPDIVHGRMDKAMQTLHTAT